MWTIRLWEFSIKLGQASKFLMLSFLRIPFLINKSVPVGPTLVAQNSLAKKTCISLTVAGNPYLVCDN